jgi:G3E family GTPase
MSPHHNAPAPVPAVRLGSESTESSIRPMLDCPTDQKIPISILTGFLGSGKTTIINHLLRSDEMSGVALLINEFGQIGIDHHLIESADESTMLLNSGCICCSIQGGVVDALKRLCTRASKGEIAPIRRVLIETSGLADPVPVVQTIVQHPFVCARFSCDGVISVVEATLQPEDITAFSAALQQISSADKILISKMDLAKDQQLSQIKHYIEQLNPGVPILEVSQGQLQLADFFADAVYSGKSIKLKQHWLGLQQVQPDSDLAAGLLQQSGIALESQAASHHLVGTISFRLPEALPWLQFSLKMGLILAQLDKRLLRCKGILKVAGERKAIVIHTVRGEAYPAIALEQWPEEESPEAQVGRLVFIIQGLHQADIDLINAHLQHLGSANQALRQLKQQPFLPTRNWLKQRINWHTPLVDHAAWLIQPKYLQGIH